MTAPGLPGIPGTTLRRAALVVPRYGVRITVMARPPPAESQPPDWGGGDGSGGAGGANLQLSGFFDEYSTGNS